MIRPNRRWFVHLLSFALLFAQLGMQVHAATHLKSDPHAPASGQLCGECASFAPLQNIVGGGATVILAVRVDADPAIESAALPDATPRAFTAFRSRAPPSFL